MVKVEEFKELKKVKCNNFVLLCRLLFVWCFFVYVLAVHIFRFVKLVLLAFSSDRFVLMFLNVFVNVCLACFWNMCLVSLFYCKLFNCIFSCLFNLFLSCFLKCMIVALFDVFLKHVLTCFTIRFASLNFVGWLM